MNDLIAEFRAGYQIPSYFSDEKVEVILQESIAWFKNQYADVDYTTDYVARELIKDRAFYSYNHVLSEFAKDRESDFITWIMSKVGGAD